MQPLLDPAHGAPQLTCPGLCSCSAVIHPAACTLSSLVGNDPTPGSTIAPGVIYPPGTPISPEFYFNNPGGSWPVFCRDMAWRNGIIGFDESLPRRLRIGFGIRDGEERCDIQVTCVDPRPAANFSVLYESNVLSMWDLTCPVPFVNSNGGVISCGEYGMHERAVHRPLMSGRQPWL